MDQSVHADFGQIPCEIMSQIFDKLAHRDRKKARLVCHRWNQILDDLRKHFVFHANWNNRSLKSILNTSLYMDRVTLQNMTSRMPTNPFPKIKESVLGWRNSPRNILKFLVGCPNVEALTIMKFSLGEISETAIRKSLNAIVWNNLTQIKLTMILTTYKFERTRIHMENCTTMLLLIKVPNVRELDLYFEDKHKCRFEEPEAQFQKVCLAMYGFLNGHANSMKILKCSIGTTRRNKFDIPKIPEMMKQSMTEQLKLESCTIKLWGVGQIEALVSPVLMGGSKLKSFDFEIVQQYWRWLTFNPATDVPTFKSNLSQIFESNHISLQNVRLYYVPFINYSWFKNCSSLKTVYVYREPVKDLNPTSDEMTVPNQIFESSSKTLISAEILDRYCPVGLAWFENCLLLENLRIPFLSLRENGDIREPNFYQEKPAYSTNLKNLYLGRYDFFEAMDGLGLEIQEVLDRNGQSLERLTLCLRSGSNIRLSNLYGLKYLHVHFNYTGHLHEYTMNCTSMNFTNLTELNAKIDCDFRPGPIRWILRNMRSLETISHVYNLSIPHLQKLLMLRKLKKIVFGYTSYITAVEKMHDFCQQTPGLQLKRTTPFSQTNHLILVDRSV